MGPSNDYTGAALLDGVASRDIARYARRYVPPLPGSTVNWRWNRLHVGRLL